MRSFIKASPSRAQTDLIFIYIFLVSLLSTREPPVIRSQCDSTIINRLAFFLIVSGAFSQEQYSTALGKDGHTTTFSKQPTTDTKKTHNRHFPPYISIWKVDAIGWRWDTASMHWLGGDLVLQLSAVFFTIYWVLPGARTSGLPFFATVFWRFITRLCRPGMENARFSFPPCVSAKVCGGGGTASGWT